MANHKGSEGHLAIGANTVAELKSWSISESANTIDDSTLTDTWTTKQLGQKSWSGSCECFWDETDTTGQGAIAIGLEVTGNFYPEGATTGDTFATGSMIVTAVETSASVDGMVEVSFSFDGNGALTWGTA